MKKIKSLMKDTQSGGDNRIIREKIENTFEINAKIAFLMTDTS